ncbi:MAG: 1-deoxy-D-xylulose-5-phosphate synthase [Candidatus Cloacimonadota bacterium]|nr:MAG: 1-deoxy-D-xylulose-5-phosphate synthase [Candidatus Cloacimonadota bacterium]
MKYLENIVSPRDLEKFDISELKIIAQEMREKIIDVVSKNGGHLAPSLGVIELTIALHYVFDAPKDKIIWDVGHQAYAHKLLTGRLKEFDSLRQHGGISGFPKREESEYDAFGTGHASTSISSALGIVAARELKGEKFEVVAVIGDGALSGGIALEGLNNAGHLKKNILIVLNDNKMSIAKNVGAFRRYLTKISAIPTYHKLRYDVWELLNKLPSSIVSEDIKELAHKIGDGLKNLIVPTMLFEELGFEYFGPVDGHNISDLIDIFSKVKRIRGPKVVHIITKKGKGYTPAESDPTHFHGLGKFDKTTGLSVSDDGPPSYSTVFGDIMVEIAQKDTKIVAITAAMPTGTGLDNFASKFPERFFDVGIAEQHAVTFAAGLATEGMKPVVAIYSTFLQRAFDQIIHDVCLQNLPVIFCMDRGGLVGEDGPTHHGTFDLSYLRLIPNMIIMAPKDEIELKDMLYTAVEYGKGPIAIRYPRGKVQGLPPKKNPEMIPIGKGELLKEGKDILIIAAGSMVYPSLDAAKILSERGLSTAVINTRFIKPLDNALIKKELEEKKLIVTVEENAVKAGFGSSITEFLLSINAKNRILNIGIPDRFIEQGNPELLRKNLGLTSSGIAKRVGDYLNDVSE